MIVVTMSRGGEIAKEETMHIFEDASGKLMALWSVAGLVIATFAAFYLDQPMSVIG